MKMQASKLVVQQVNLSLKTFLFTHARVKFDTDNITSGVFHEALFGGSVVDFARIVNSCLEERANFVKYNTLIITKYKVNEYNR